MERKRFLRNAKDSYGTQKIHRGRKRFIGWGEPRGVLAAKIVKINRRGKKSIKKKTNEN